MAQDGATIVGVGELTPAEERAARALLANGAAHDGAAPLIELPPPDPAGGDTRRYLLARAGEELVGLLALVGYREVEGSGLVAPGWRRRGLGRRLVAAASAEVARHGLTDWLLTCDEAVASGPAFAAALGAARAFAEYRMTFDPTIAAPPPPPSALDARLATAGDIPAIAAIVAEAFGDPPDQLAAWLAGDLGRADRRWFLATVGGEPIGSLRVIAGEAGDDITAFGILPAHQRRGYGRALLARTLALLRAEGDRPINIEVEIDNAAALALYRSSGFVTRHTYSYWRVAV